MKQGYRHDTGQCAVFSSVPAEVCHSVGDVLARVGDKWSILIIAVLSPGKMRFSALKSALRSISPKVLTSALRGLERDGYVARTVTATRPPQVDYELTALGRDVLVPVVALAEWAFTHRHVVAAARTAFDHRAARLVEDDR